MLFNFLNFFLWWIELYLQNGWPTKGVKPYFPAGYLSKVVTIANLRHTGNRISTCAESELRSRWMKLRGSENHYINQFVNLSIIEVRLFHDWNLDLSVLLNYFSIALPVSMLRFKCHKVEFNAVSQGKRTSQFSILASFSGVSYSGMVLRVVSSPGFLTVDFPIILAQFSDSFNLLVNF